MTVWTPTPEEIEAMVVESQIGCGTTGCEAHDGECRDNWKWFHGQEH